MAPKISSMFSSGFGTPIAHEFNFNLNFKEIYLRVVEDFLVNLQTPIVYSGLFKSSNLVKFILSFEFEQPPKNLKRALNRNAKK